MGHRPEGALTSPLGGVQLLLSFSSFSPKAYPPVSQVVA